VPGALGPRFLIEAGFIIAVAVVAGIERFRTTTIVLVMAAAWLAVAALELVLAWRRRAGVPSTPAETAAQPEPRAQPKPVAPQSPAVRVLRPEAPLAQEPEPEPAPEPEVTPPQEEAPAAEPPRPVPEQPRVAVVPRPPEPAPAPPEPEPEPAVVALTPRRVEPREWNVWELERVVRERSSGDVARDEERAYLLMYLREFASPDGLLPIDFDSVVRESFGDALDAIRW
jgi:outer membrane biosynthesis protein TonB